MLTSILIKIVEYLVAEFFKWIVNEASRNPSYKNIKNNISQISQNKELNELVNCSIRNALKNEKIKSLSPNEIEESLKHNMTYIFQWIILNDSSDISFANYSDKLFYNVNEDEFRLLYNSLYHQIQGNKNSYSTLQNLMIIEKIEEVDTKINNLTGMVSEIKNSLLVGSQNVIYTGELKEVEEKIKLRKFIEARVMLNSIEHKLLGQGNLDDKEKFYQLLTESYMLDSINQREAIKYYEKLIIYSSDIKMKEKRELMKCLLERNISLVQEKLDTIFNKEEIDVIDPIYYDIQINLLIFQKELDKAIDFVKNNKNNIENYPLWMCRLSFYKSDIYTAKDVIDDNEEYFNKSDFQVQVLKITILSAVNIDRAASDKTFQNMEVLMEYPAKINALIEKCGDDNEQKSHFHSILGLIYAVLDEPDNSRKEYEKSLEFYSMNMNTLKYFPYILINSRKKTDQERALVLIRSYLKEYPNDYFTETLYYNCLVFLSPHRAVEEILAYEGSNENIKPFLLYSYDILHEFTKAEKLIETFLSKQEISSTECFFIGIHYESLNKNELALDYYYKSIKNGKTNIEIDRTIDKLLKLTIFLKENKNIENLIIFLEDIFTADEIILKFIDLFTYALTLIHNYEKCAWYCNTAINKNIHSKTILEALFLSYYNTRNFKLALDIIQKYISNYGQPPSRYLNYIAVCCIEIDELEKAYDIIKYLPTPESANDYLQQTVFLKQIKKEKEALAMIHKAYQSYPKNQRIMEFFINLGIINRGISISEEISKSLQKCFSEYINSNYKNKILKDFKIDVSASPEEIKKQLSDIIPDSSDEVEKMEQINSSKLPITFYKQVINRNYLFIHHYLTMQNKYKIWCFDYFSKNNNLKNKRIYIDLSSLLVLDTLNLLNTIPKYFSEIYVTQSIFNELRNFNVDKKPDNEDSFTISKVDGNIYFNKDLMPYNVISEKSIRLISFIKNNDNIKIVGNPLLVVNKMPDDLYKIIKKGIADIDLELFDYGYRSNNVIMLENMTFRKLFNSIEKTPGSFCIIDYLYGLLKEDIITFSKYCNCLSLLSKQNYVFIPFNYKILMLLIQENGYIIDNSITIIFDNICSEPYDKNRSTVLIVSLIFNIWENFISIDVKHKWHDYLFEKLIVMNNPDVKNLAVICNVISYNMYNMKFQRDFISYANDFLKKYGIDKKKDNY